MGEFRDIEIEIRSRSYRWAMRDAEREVSEGYPLLRRIESRTVKIFLNYMSEFSHDGQLEIALALAKRVHEFAIKGNDDALTTRERRLVDEYLQFQFEYSDLDKEEGFIRSWVPRRAVGLPARAKLKRKQFLRKVSETLKPLLVGFTERLGTEDISFERNYNKWTVRTSVYVGRPPHYFHRIRADWREVLATTITSWLGVGDGAWDVLYEDRSAEAAETFGMLCAHFMTAIPELLDGLDYDESTLLDPVSR
jgi:hypothetical protein